MGFKREKAVVEGVCTQFALRDSKLDDGTFSGMASVFGSNVAAWVPTVIRHGAFKKTLSEGAMKRVKILWQHKTDEPIGMPLRLEETPEGLYLEAKLSDTQRGRDALRLMRDGVLDGLSIGFDPIQWSMEPAPAPAQGQSQQGDSGTAGRESNSTAPPSQVRHIHEVRLHEVSVVTWGADGAARIREVHSPYDHLPIPIRKALAGLVSLDLTREERDAVDAVMAGGVVEKFAGRVLSAANKSLLEAAVQSLQALLKAAEPPAETDAEDADEDARDWALQGRALVVERLAKLREAQLNHARYGLIR